MILLMLWLSKIERFNYLWRKLNEMKFVGFVITIIVASSAFFTLLAISVGSVVLFKKDKETEEEPIALD